MAATISPAMTDLDDESTAMAHPSNDATTMRRSPKLCSGMDSSRHTFQTNFAFILSCVTLLLMAVLSLLFSEFDTSSESSSTHRWLEEANDDNSNNDDGSSNTNTDYTSFSCGYMYDQTPDAGDAQCQFARTCNQGNGIWAPFVFCSSTFSTTFLVSAISPLMFLWLVLLFRMLGSTAEDYFSPGTYI
jgi:hypothetical protein